MLSDRFRTEQYLCQIYEELKFQKSTSLLQKKIPQLKNCLFYNYLKLKDFFGLSC